MKKAIAILLCVACMLCLTSCNKSRETQLTTDNAFNYVHHTLTFGEITVRENTKPAINSGKYYITCTATLRIAPSADYSFSDAFIWLGFDFKDGWRAIRVGNNTAGTSILYTWDDVIHLDKDGYAIRTIELFCYSNDYDKLHPSRAKYEYSLASADGTVTENK